MNNKKSHKDKFLTSAHGLEINVLKARKILKIIELYRFFSPLEQERILCNLKRISETTPGYQEQLKKQIRERKELMDYYYSLPKIKRDKIKQKTNQNVEEIEKEAALLEVVEQFKTSLKRHYIKR